MGIFGFTLNKKNAAKEWVEKGDRAKDPKEKYNCYVKATELDPKNAFAWFNKGNNLAELGKHEEAIQAYEKTIELNPKDSDAWFNKGNSFEDLGKHEEAIQAYEKVIELNPKDPDAWFNKGNCFADIGKYEEAIRAYEKAIELDPKDSDAWFRKGIFFAKLGKFEEALRAYEKVIELNPRDSDAWFHKGVCLTGLGKYEEALLAYKRVIELDPKNSDAWFHKGTIFAKLGKYEEALRAHEKAIELDLKDPDAWLEKDTNLVKLKRYEKFLSIYKRVTALFSDDKALKGMEEKFRILLFRSQFKLSFSFSETGLEYNTWQACTFTVANTGTGQLNNITLSFSGDVVAKGIKPFSLVPSEQQEYQCSLKAMARGTVPVEITVTAEDSTKEQYAATYDYSIRVTDPQRSAAHSPVSPDIAKQTISPELFPLERTIYDPVLQDFLVSSERPLVNIRKWIEDRDSGSYWFVICIHNSSDNPLDEWGIELSATSSLQVVDACIEGYGESATVRESHPAPWLSQWVIGVSHHAGIVIPRSGSRRIYIKLGSNACGVSHTIKGRCMTSHGIEVPIREKTFTYSCDVATLRTALSSDPAAAGQYAENIIRRAYDRDTALKLLRSFKLVQEIDQCCTLQKYDEILNRMQLLAGTLESIQAGDTLTRLVKQNYDALTILGDSEASAERAQRLCSNVIDVWINEFICMEDPKKHSFKSKSRERGEDAGKCPACGSRLVWRRAQKNNELYRGCTNFDGGCRWNDRSY